MLTNLTRRAALALGGMQIFSTGAALAVATPRQRSLPRRRGAAGVPAGAGPGWDLVADAPALRRRGAQIMHLFGQVLDFDGRPIGDVSVEIWQCTPEGRHLYDGGTRDGEDADFRGHGATRSDPRGHYRFRTILPVADGARPPVIHARLASPRGRVLETQLYLVDDALNDSDWHYGSLGPSGQAAVSIDPAVRADRDLEAGFNFVL